MVNPLDSYKFNDQGERRRTLKISQVPQIATAIKESGFSAGLERHDEQMEEWRQRLQAETEKALSELAGRIPAATTSTATSAPAPAGVTAAQLNAVEASLTSVINSLSTAISSLISSLASLNNSQPRWGSLALANAVDSGSVSWILPWVPQTVIAWIERPAGGLNISAMVNSDSVSAAGFDFELSGMTDSADYVLGWVAFK